jgi:hypothetical protein
VYHITTFEIINGETEHKTSVEDKPGTTAIKAYQDKQRNVSG